MTLEERMARMEARAGKDDEMIRELRDAVTVTAHMEAASSRALKDHANWLVAHDKALLSSREEHDRRMKELDERIANLVSGFGEFMRRERGQ